MAEHPNVQRIRDAYAAFGDGDLASALKDLAPNAVFHFNGSGPLSGDHTGVDDISAALIGAFELTAGTQKLDIASVFADDHHGVVVLRATASRPDGATLMWKRCTSLRSTTRGASRTSGTCPAIPKHTTGSSTASSCRGGTPDAHGPEGTEPGMGAFGHNQVTKLSRVDGLHGEGHPKLKNLRIGRHNPDPETGTPDNSGVASFATVGRELGPYTSAPRTPLFHQAGFF